MKKENIETAITKLIESPFTDAQKSWEKSGFTPDEVELMIDKFRMLKDRNVVRGEEADIGKWISKGFDEFKKFVEEKEAHVSKIVKRKEKQHDADVVFEDEEAMIVVPKSYEASCKYGKGSKWCTASGSTRSHWDSYADMGTRLFYVISKKLTKEDNPVMYKVAVSVPPHLGGKPASLTFYNAEDNTITREKFKEFYPTVPV